MNGTNTDDVEGAVALLSMESAVRQYNEEIKRRFAPLLLDESSATETSGTSTSTHDKPDAAEPRSVAEDTELAAAKERATDWMVINTRLTASGFPEVEVAANCDDLGVRRVFKEVLDQFMGRGRRIEELVGRTGGPAGWPSPAPMPRYFEPRLTTDSRAEFGTGTTDFEASVSETRRRHSIKSLEDEVTVAQGEAAGLRRRLVEEEKRHLAAARELKLQVRQSEHRVKVQEAASERLAAKLKAQVEVERSTRERDRKAFMKLARRAVSRLAVHFLFLFFSFLSRPSPLPLIDDVTPPRAYVSTFCCAR